MPQAGHSFAPPSLFFVVKEKSSLLRVQISNKIVRLESARKGVRA